MKASRLSLVLSACVLAVTFPARAHREDYLDETLVYQTLDRHEFEPEYWFDYGWDGQTDNYFARHHLSVEYGFTDHWMLDGRATAIKPHDDGLEFDSARLETRYRFADEGTYPVDIAVSSELNVEREEDGQYRYGIEPRLILSRDFDKLNLTLNFSEELPFNSGSPDFLMASGLRYDATRLFRLGSELQYDTRRQTAAVVPQIWFTLPHEITLKLGWSHGFDRSREDFFRVVVELGF